MRPRLFSVISNSWAEICWFSAAISLSLAFKRSFLTVNVVTFSFCRDKIRCSVTKFHLFHPLTLYSPFLFTPTSALPLPISHFPIILCPSSLLPSNRRRKGGGTRGTCPPLETYTLLVTPLQIATPQYVRTRRGICVLASHARGILLLLGICLTTCSNT